MDAYFYITVNLISVSTLDDTSKNEKQEAECIMNCRSDLYEL